MLIGYVNRANREEAGSFSLTVIPACPEAATQIGWSSTREARSYHIHHCALLVIGIITNLAQSMNEAVRLPFRLIRSYALS
jgi:hypothetical protein